MFHKIIFGISAIISIFIVPVFYRNNKELLDFLDTFQKTATVYTEQHRKWDYDYSKGEIETTGRDLEYLYCQDSIAILHKAVLSLINEKKRKCEQNNISIKDIHAVNKAFIDMNKKMIDYIDESDKDAYWYPLYYDTIIYKKNYSAADTKILLQKIEVSVNILALRRYDYCAKETKCIMHCYNDKYHTFRIAKKLDLRENVRTQKEVCLVDGYELIWTRQNQKIWVNDSLLYKTRYTFTPKRTGAHTFHVKALVQTKDSTVTLRDTFSVFVGK